MAHGTPDWGLTAGAVTTYQLTDLGELAVRLGSIDSFDRRGDVIWLDDFEAGLRAWTATLGAADAAVDLSTVTARSGLFSARLVTDKAGGRLAQITHRDRFPVLSQLGFEASFALEDHISALYYVYQAYDGENLIDWRIRWDDVGRVLQYRDANLNYVTIAGGVNLLVNPALFYTLKMVVDAAGRVYSRVILNETSYSLADIPARVSGSELEPQVFATLLLTGLSGQNNTIYADDVILTQNEPA